MYTQLLSRSVRALHVVCALHTPGSRTSGTSAALWGRWCMGWLSDLSYTNCTRRFPCSPLAGYMRRASFLGYACVLPCRFPHCSSARRVGCSAL
eukprot:4987465-Alexandrium_andersonii.AAC.1